MPKKKIEVPPPPEEGMQRVSDLTPEEIMAVVDACPREMTPGAVVEIIINILGNYEMLDEVENIIAHLIMFRAQSGIVTQAVEVEEEEERLH